MDVELPTSPETERKLLGAMLLMLPGERDAMVGKVSDVWFADPWHRRFFNALVRNRGRDFTAETLEDAKAGDCDLDRTAYWISQLLVNPEGKPLVVNHRCWKSYAATLEKVYSWRVRILCKIEELRDLCDAARTETIAICEFAAGNAETNARVPRKASGIVLDGTELT